MSSIHSLQLWVVTSPLPPFITSLMWHHENVLTSSADPQSINLMGVTAEPGVRSWRTQPRSCGQVTLPRATGKVSALCDLLTQLHWSHRKHRCRHWAAEAKIPCGSVEIVPSEVIPDWLPKTLGPKKCHQRVMWGSMEDHSTLGMWSLSFHLPLNLPDSPSSTNPALGWVVLCVGKRQEQSAPITHPDGAVQGKQDSSFSHTAFRQWRNLKHCEEPRISRFPCHIYRQLETY